MKLFDEQLWSLCNVRVRPHYSFRILWKIDNWMHLGDIMLFNYVILIIYQIYTWFSCFCLDTVIESGHLTNTIGNEFIVTIVFYSGIADITFDGFTLIDYNWNDDYNCMLGPDHTGSVSQLLFFFLTNRALDVFRMALQKKHKLVKTLWFPIKKAW